MRDIGARARHCQVLLLAMLNKATCPSSSMAPHTHTHTWQEQGHAAHKPHGAIQQFLQGMMQWIGCHVCA